MAYVVVASGVASCKKPEFLTLLRGSAKPHGALQLIDASMLASIFSIEGTIRASTGRGINVSLMS
jgi:hypothetical protein